ncbi:hypothetical protein DL769_004882 [Monosporascus sp. CRB-8-3]|nr:hypothetical protein DL769_004882 [Monosporascus sp. CRB-8-3]
MRGLGKRSVQRVPGNNSRTNAYGLAACIGQVPWNFKGVPVQLVGPAREVSRIIYGLTDIEAHRVAVQHAFLEILQGGQLWRISLHEVGQFTKQPPRGGGVSCLPAGVCPFCGSNSAVDIFFLCGRDGRQAASRAGIINVQFGAVVCRHELVINEQAGGDYSTASDTVTWFSRIESRPTGRRTILSAVTRASSAVDSERSEIKSELEIGNPCISAELWPMHAEVTEYAVPVGGPASRNSKGPRYRCSGHAAAIPQIQGFSRSFEHIPRLPASGMTKRIHRVTVFKIPNDEDQQKLLDIYREMPQKAIKDDKPYILSVTPGKAFPDQRAQGYTVAVVSVFALTDDMAYYDNKCEAHANLKLFAKTVHQGAMMVYYESIFD